MLSMQHGPLMPAGYDHGLGGLPLPGALGTTGQPGQHDTDAMLPAGAGNAANETSRNVEVTPVEVRHGCIASM